MHIHPPAHTHTDTQREREREERERERERESYRTGMCLYCCVWIGLAVLVYCQTAAVYLILQVLGYVVGPLHCKTKLF
jgi:hypothetical protein